MARTTLPLLTTLFLSACATTQSGLRAYHGGDYSAAIGAWTPLAEAGEPDAQFFLGTMYDDGVGVQEIGRAHV